MNPDDLKVKILGIVGTPIKDGNCQYLLEQALRVVESGGSGQQPSSFIFRTTGSNTASRGESKDRIVLASLKTLEYQRKQWAKQGDAEAFHQKWVEPFRDIIIWREKLITEKAVLAFATTKDYLKEFDDSIFEMLLQDTHPRYLEAATWLTGLSKNEKYLSQLEDLFLKNEWYREFSIHSYCFALVRLGQAIPCIDDDWWDKDEFTLVVEELCKLLS